MVSEHELVAGEDEAGPRYARDAGIVAPPGRCREIRQTGVGEDAMSPEHEREFREFVAARSAGLLRTAYFLTGGDVHDAQDLLQTALMATARHWGRISDVTSPRRT